MKTDIRQLLLLIGLIILTVAPVSEAGLVGEVDSFVRGTGEPAWLAWSVPVVAGTHSVCCGNCSNVCRLDKGRAAEEPRGGSAAEEPRGGSAAEEPRGGRAAEEPRGGRGHTLHITGESGLGVSNTVTILVQAADRTVTEIRVVSGNCVLDSGDSELRWLENVDPAASVDFLLPFAEGQSRVDRESALVALALHAGSAADEALLSLSEAGNPGDVREEAFFWLGHARGRFGYEALRRALGQESSSGLREHLVFVLSQSEEPEATDDLIGLAHDDPHPEVRSQALFWLAETAGEEALAAISDAVADDPDLEVRRHALFAMSEVSGERGLQALIDVASNSGHHPELRKEAFFWLGQSEDPRALEFIEDVLSPANP